MGKGTSRRESWIARLQEPGKREERATRGAAVSSRKPAAAAGERPHAGGTRKPHLRAWMHPGAAKQGRRRSRGAIGYASATEDVGHAVRGHTEQRQLNGGARDGGVVVRHAENNYRSSDKLSTRHSAVHHLSPVNSRGTPRGWACTGFRRC